MTPLWLEAAEACEAWVLDQRINHNRDWWLEPRVPSGEAT